MYSKNEKVGTLPNSFQTSSITFKTNPVRNTTEQETADQFPDEHSCKNPQKPLANNSKSTSKRPYHLIM
jgi:hypothetical protein